MLAAMMRRSWFCAGSCDGACRVEHAQGSGNDGGSLEPLHVARREGRGQYRDARANGRPDLWIGGAKEGERGNTQLGGEVAGAAVTADDQARGSKLACEFGKRLTHDATVVTKARQFGRRETFGFHFAGQQSAQMSVIPQLAVEGEESVERPSFEGRPCAHMQQHRARRGRAGFDGAAGVGIESPPQGHP